MGLHGTGSTDFVIDDAFVPIIWPSAWVSRRAGCAAVHLGDRRLIGHTVPAVAIGVAQRALDELVALARYK